jgi:hypothetical protein
MAGIIRDLEDALVHFVRFRIPEGEWEQLNTSGLVLSRLDEEAEEELRTHFFNELMASLNWNNILDDIRRMRENLVMDEDTETDEYTEDEEDNRSTKSDVSCFSSR